MKTKEFTMNKIIATITIATIALFGVGCGSDTTVGPQTNDNTKDTTDVVDTSGNDVIDNTIPIPEINPEDDSFIDSTYNMDGMCDDIRYKSTEYCQKQPPRDIDTTTVNCSDKRYASTEYCKKKADDEILGN